MSVATVFTASDDGRVLGVLVPADFDDFDGYVPHDGARAYVTDAELPLQLNVITGPPGYRSVAHIHPPLPQPVLPTRHTAVIAVTGSIRVHLGDAAGAPVASVDLRAGDAVLCTEGHQLELLSPGARLLEVKQGPYPGSQEADRDQIPDLV
jgi:hypothetical protein